MKDKEHWRWMAKQSETMSKRSLVGDRQLREEIELLEDQLLTLRKDNDRLKEELNNVKRDTDVRSQGIYGTLSQRDYEYGFRSVGLGDPYNPYAISRNEPRPEPSQGGTESAASQLFRSYRR